MLVGLIGFYCVFYCGCFYKLLLFVFFLLDVDTLFCLFYILFNNIFNNLKMN